MKMIIIFFKSLFQSFLDLCDKSYSVQYIEDPIDNPKKKILYIVGTVNDPWQAELLCPCGCKDKIVLPVNNSTKPHWSLNITIKKTPSLSPSIWRTKGCKSHFFLKKGKIKWC